MIGNIELEKLEFDKVLEYVSNYTATENGKQIILSSHPSSEKVIIEKLGSYVSDAKEILIRNDIPPFEYLPDLNEELAKSKIEGAVLNKKAIRSILTLAEVSRRVHKFLASQVEESILYNNFGNKLFVNLNFEKDIQNVFSDSGDIKDSASKKLREIRNDINDKSDQLRKQVNRILKKLSDSFLVQEEYITQRDGRIVLPIKAEHKRHVKGFIHSESATGQTVYIEPEETLELNNEILSLGFAEKREIERILKQLTNHIKSFSANLRTSSYAISELDAIFAKAKYSLEVIGSFPLIKECGGVHLMNARHPILLKKMGRDKAIPLNVKVNRNKVVLITGPNAGGKTVVLKTIGLISLMVMSGFHVPVDPDSEVSIFTDILIDIGDQQSIEDDLSTFSSHLTNINYILEKAGESSLILIDEIGTGTDPSEGAAIAAAVLIRLFGQGALVFASTHHGNLKLIANDLDGFENASMEFDSDKLIPSYRFQQGIPGSSYAFEVARKIGFSEDFISLSKQYLDSKKTKIEDFLLELESKASKLTSKLNESERENARLNGLTSLYQSKISELEKQKKKIIQDTQHKAESYLKNVNKEVENTIRKIKETNADKDSIKQGRDKLNQLKEKNISLAKKEEKEKKFEFEVGDYAKLVDTTTSGVITELIIEKKKAILTVGNLKMLVKLNELEPTQKRKEEKLRSNEYDQMIYASSKLDIRGQRPEEAENEIITFLDNAYTGSVSPVEIIHGKGTGVLKQSVHDILKKQNYIKSYYFAKVDHGGEGITIIEFK